MPPIGGVRAGYLSAKKDAIPDSVASRPDDDDVTSTTTETGIEISLSDNWVSIGARISSNSANMGTAYLRDNNQNLITSQDVSGLTGGDAFTFNNVNLASGNTYYITLDNGGNSWSQGFNRSADSYPYSSSAVDITGRIIGTAVEQKAAVSIEDVGDVGF